MSYWGLDDRYLAGSGPRGAQWTPCGFLAVAISGLCTELFLLLTIQSKGERGRRKEENARPWSILEGEFHGDPVLMFMDHYGLRSLQPGKGLSVLRPAPLEGSEMPTGMF